MQLQLFRRQMASLFRPRIFLAAQIPGLLAVWLEFSWLHFGVADPSVAWGAGLSNYLRTGGLMTFLAVEVATLLTLAVCSAYGHWSRRSVAFAIGVIPLCTYLLVAVWIFRRGPFDLPFLIWGVVVAILYGVISACLFDLAASPAFRSTNSHKSSSRWALTALKYIGIAGLVALFVQGAVAGVQSPAMLVLSQREHREQFFDTSLAASGSISVTRIEKLREALNALSLRTQSGRPVFAYERQRILPLLEGPEAAFNDPIPAYTCRALLNSSDPTIHRRLAMREITGRKSCVEYGRRNQFGEFESIEATARQILTTSTSQSLP